MSCSYSFVRVVPAIRDIYMRRKYIWDKAKKEFVDYYSPERLASPTVIQDTIEATRHPIDRKFYDSKSAYDAVTRRHGATEIGPDGAREMVARWKGPPEVNVRGCIEKAFEKINQGYRPAPLERDDSISRVINDRGRN